MILGRFNIRVTNKAVVLDYCDNGTYISYRDHVRAMQEEIASLRHDIDRHVAIAAEQATRIAELEKVARATAELVHAIETWQYSSAPPTPLPQIARQANNASNALREAGYLKEGDV